MSRQRAKWERVGEKVALVSAAPPQTTMTMVTPKSEMEKEKLKMKTSETENKK